LDAKSNKDHDFARRMLFQRGTEALKEALKRGKAFLPEWE